MDADISTIGEDAAAVSTVAELARLLRVLRRREARDRDGATLTYREIAARTGWSHAIIGEYLTGTALPPTDRFDHLVQILGATRSELRALGTARDRVEELRRPTRSAETAPATPRELPAPVAGFVGRGTELATLDRLAVRDHDGVRIVLLTGPSGVGKSALAVQWARGRAADFPDGQVYVHLRGAGPGRPIAPGEALGRLLGALGADPGKLPVGVDDRAARYRTMLADRRLLILADDAASAEQLRPLLPGSGTCLVLATSRAALTGLVATDGAQRLTLDALTEPEALALLRSLLADRADATPDALCALVEWSGGTPRALRLAAERALANPELSLSAVLGELRSGPA